jgi:hypothetical protein
MNRAEEVVGMIFLGNDLFGFDPEFHKKMKTLLLL